MNENDVRRHFEETSGLLTGHFKLSSGLHSDRYLQCARLLQWPARAAALGDALAAQLRGLEVEAVVSPAMGGLIIGHELGRGLGVRAIFAERVDGVFTFRRGLGLEPGETVVVVEDVVTTGKSTREVLDLVNSRKALPVACASIVDRRGESRSGDGGMLDGMPVISLLKMEVPTWEPAACPLCAKGISLDVPGSRYLGGASS